MNSFYTALQPQIAERRAWIEKQHIGRLGLLMDNGMEWIAWDLAAREAGITCIPLPTFFNHEQLKHCINTAGIDAIARDRIEMINDDVCNAPLYTTDGTIISKLTFTSGSTGTPKGVLLTQTAIDRVVDSLAQGLARIDMGTHLCLVPLSILLENIAGVYLPLRLGNPIAVPALSSLGIIGSNGLDIHKLAAAINHYKPGSLVLFPQLLLALTELAEQKKISCESFRFLAVGGARVSPALLQRARKAGLPVYEGYGLSECASVVALNLPHADRPGSVGRVLPHQQVTIENGEVVVRGCCFSGYLESSGVITTTDRVQTGDEGYLDKDGFLYIQGRRKHVIVNSWGRNINPEWPESRLVECPAIQHALVTGEAKPFLSAIIVTNENSLDPVQRQVTAINDTLPDYARIQRWLVVKPDTLRCNNLVTTNGRLKRKQIEDFFAKDINKLYEVAL